MDRGLWTVDFLVDRHCLRILVQHNGVAAGSSRRFEVGTTTPGNAAGSAGGSAAAAGVFVVKSAPGVAGQELDLPVGNRFSVICHLPLPM